MWWNSSNNSLQETLHLFMRFPRCGFHKYVDVKLISGLLDISSYELDYPSILSAADVTLLEKLVSVACVIDADERVCELFELFLVLNFL